MLLSQVQSVCIILCDTTSSSELILLSLDKTRDS